VEIVYLEDVHITKTKKYKKGGIQKRTIRQIQGLEDGKAILFNIKDDNDVFTLRARFKRAAKALGVNIKVQRRGKQVRIWKEDT
jgi:hypothetical protein